MYMLIEKISPFFFAFLGVFFWSYLNLSLPTGEGVLGSSLTIGAIFSGFLATAKAILMSLDSDVMKRIRDTTYMNELVMYLAHAIWLSFSFCIVSLIGYFINTANYWYGMVWIWVAIAMAVAFIRFTNIMLKILQKS
jgi:hypothetical protein